MRQTTGPARTVLKTPAQAGEIFRGRRKARRTSQAELAAELGVGQSRLSALEADASGMTLERFLLLAKLLGLQVVLEEASAGPKRALEW